MENPKLWKNLSDEFPEGADEWPELGSAVSRRRFLQVMGGSLALAGLNACTKVPAEKIIPYVVAPENLVPGEAKFYASSMTLSGYARGVLVKSHEGRPTKVEGNPLHPTSQGKSDLFMQAELLQLYDPERSKSVQHLGQTSTWDAFIREANRRAALWTMDQGAGLRILTGTITSPTLAASIRTFLKRYPRANWIAYEPIHSEAPDEASLALFGKVVRPLPDFSKARVIVSIDSDFLGPSPTQLSCAREFASRRAVIEKASDYFSRLYLAESTLSLTGASADQRIALPPSSLEKLTRAVAHAVGVSVQEIPSASLSDAEKSWIQKAVRDLHQNQGQSVIVAGPHLPASIHMLVAAMNEKLGNVGHALTYLPVVESSPLQKTSELRQLIQECQAGKVTDLFIFGGNPAYQTPKTLQFAEALKKVEFRAHLSSYADETSLLCQWHLPESHFLESWGDALSFKGELSFQQPLIAPMYESKTAVELVSILLQNPGRSDYQALQEYWSSKLGSGENSRFEKAIHDGVLIENTSVAQNPRINPHVLTRLPAQTAAETNDSTGTLEVSFRPDPTIWDGRYSNNSWLQELPKPILQIAWDNAALFSPSTASRLGLKTEDTIEITADTGAIRAPVLVVPGHPENTVTLTLGYGRTRSGHIGNQRGYDAYALMSETPLAPLGSVLVRKTGENWPLASVHDHQSMEGRDPVVRASLPEFQEKREQIIPTEMRDSHPPSLFANRENASHAWAMVINLSTCIGCKTCTIACQAENNIPVVGKDEMRRSREMHWIRVDRYFEGDASNPRIYFQPVPCMHCEAAPCELVCPTVATNHSSEGLNQMVYNRCVGTRYCSNNCPYKVRRFNFFQYSDTKNTSIRMMQNPDVTVRTRGVMEKCTYCVQRIQATRINSEKERRAIRDGEIQTACQQACPTHAIVFGDKNDPASEVSRLRSLSNHYYLLAELGTRPRTSYLAAVRNPGSEAHL